MSPLPIALAPLLTLFGLLVVAGRPLAQSAPTASGVAAGIGYIYWKMSPSLLFAAGNRVALPNLPAVQAKAGMKDEERSHLKSLTGPCTVYLAVAGLVGAILI